MNEWKRILIMMFVRDLTINNKLELALKRPIKKDSQNDHPFQYFCWQTVKRLEPLDGLETTTQSPH